MSALRVTTAIVELKPTKSQNALSISDHCHLDVLLWPSLELLEDVALVMKGQVQATCPERQLVVLLTCLADCGLRRGEKRQQVWLSSKSACPVKVR